MSNETDTSTTCPVCRSPLIPEAIEKGKCQCCGAKLEAEEAETEPAGND